MIALFSYILKVLLISGIMYGYYLLMLRNKKFHGFNRFYLLFTMMLPIILPFINVSAILAVHQDVIPVLLGNDTEAESIVIRKTTTTIWDVESIINVAYLVVTGLLLAWLLSSLYRIILLSRKGTRIFIHGIILVTTRTDGTPFSFFNHVFWNPDEDLKTDKSIRMLEHEITHCRQLHSVDKIWARIVCCVFWFNPVFWAVKKEIHLVHEFLADKRSFASDSAAFSRILLEEMYPGYHWPLANSFFYSPIKRRIMMLLKSNHQKVNYFGRLMVLPLAAALFIFFTIKASAKQDLPEVMESQTDTIPTDISSAEIRQIVVVTKKNGQKDTLSMDEARKAGFIFPPPPPPPPPSQTSPPPPPVPPASNTSPTGQVPPTPPAPPAPPSLDKLPDDMVYMLNGKKVDKATIENLDGDQIVSINIQKSRTAAADLGDINKRGLIHISTKNFSDEIGTNADTIPELEMIFTRVERDASFRGGPNAWPKYISKVLTKHMDEFGEEDYGTCEVRFIIDKRGNVHDVKAITMVGTKLAEVAEDAIRNGPKWIPAQQNGNFVNVYKKIPVTLKR